MLAALIIQIVIIAAVGNQWVTNRIYDSTVGDSNDSFAHYLKYSLITYNWRFAPQNGDSQHNWLSQVLMILAVLVLSAALIAIVVRGPITFGRALFGCWMSVIVATMFAAYVRGLVNDFAGFPGSRITRAMFGPLGPNTITFLAGVLLGLAVGLVAAVVAVTTRRAAGAGPAPAPPAAPFFPPEQPPPYYGEPGNVPPWQDQRYGPSGRHAAQPAAAPAGEPAAEPAEPSAPTTRLPAAGEATTQSGPPRVGDQLTVQFPRPPDDDDIGHVGPS